MPTIEERQHPSGTTYRAKVRVKGYPPQQATFDRKTDALRWAQRTEADLRENKYFPSAKAKKTTVAELIDSYLRHLETSNRRRHDEVKRMLLWWKHELGETMLSHLSSEQISKSQHKLSKRVRERKQADGTECTLSPATVNRHISVLQGALTYCVKTLKWLHDNPTKDVKKLTESLGRIRFLSPDELDRLVAACKVSKNPYLLAIVIIGLSTGARRNEIRYMKWSDVNEDVSLVTIPKTKNGTVHAAQLTGAASTLVRKMRGEKGQNIYLFPSPNDPNRPIDFESAWRKALETANIHDFRFHDNRHTCASYLAMNGASLLVIANTLGHKDLAMVQRYAHLTQPYVSSVVQEMTEKRFGHVEV